MVVSTQLKKIMVKIASKKYGAITPCPKAKELLNNKSFTIFKNNVFFWFNDSTGSTRVIVIKFDNNLLVNKKLKDFLNK